MTNTGTQVVSTLQFKIGYYNTSDALVWVSADYLQTNLLPGEQRALSFQLDTDYKTMQHSEITQALVNGSQDGFTNAPLQKTIDLPDGYHISLAYDAMVYEPLH